MRKAKAKPVRCDDCGRVFASVSPLTRHRTGGGKGKRCMTDAELSRAGIAFDPAERCFDFRNAPVFQMKRGGDVRPSRVAIFDNRIAFFWAGVPDS